MFYGSATTIKFWVQDYSSRSAVATISPLIWNHVVGTYNYASGASDGLVRIFLNGVFINSIAVSVGLTNSANVMEFGQMSNNTQNINGHLDDIRLYARQLTPTDVLSLY